MRTFSEIVDALSTSTVSQRPLESYIIAVQEALSEAGLHNQMSAWDTVEFNINCCDLASGNRWHLPPDFGSGLEVRYDHNPEPIPQKKLGSVAPGSPRYWYQASDYIVFSGRIAQSVQLAYKRIYRPFRYYPPAVRLLRSSESPDHVFDYRPNPDAEWIPYTPDHPDHAASYFRHTNWLIERWGTMIHKGAKSYVMNETGNLDVGGRLYNSFIRQLNLIKNME